MILISNLTLNIKDGSTIASTNIYGADKKTYINIGSGNVFNLEWSTPTLTNDIVDHYDLVVKRYDQASNLYFNLFEENIGLVNYFSVNSDILPLAPDQYLLSIYVVAYGKSGNVVTSNILNPYVCRASGTYVKTDAGYMKRALGFVYTPEASKVAETGETKGDDSVTLDVGAETILTDSDGNILVDVDGVMLTIAAPFELLDINGNPLISTGDVTLFAFANKLLESTSGWQLVREGYTKGEDGEWHTNDIKYEALAMSDGIVEVLVNGIYEPLYIL